MHATEDRANLEGGAANGAVARLSGRGTGTMGGPVVPHTVADALHELTEGGSRRAFAGAVRIHSRTYRVEFDDLYQESIIGVMTNFHRYRPGEWELVSWAGWISRSVAAEIVRVRQTLKRRNKNVSISDAEAADGVFNVADPCAVDPVEAACDTERRAFVARTVRPVFEQLAGRMKGTKLLVLRRRLLTEDPAPYSELAQQAGVKEGAINGRMCALKKEFAENDWLRELAEKLRAL